MNLDVIQVLQLYAMLSGNGQCVACETGKISGMLVEPPNASGGHDRVTGMDEEGAVVPCPGLDAGTGSVCGENIRHKGVFHDIHIGERGCPFLEDRGNGLTGDILMKTDSGPGMGAFLCIF